MSCGNAMYVIIDALSCIIFIILLNYIQYDVIVLLQIMGCDLLGRCMYSISGGIGIRLLHGAVNHQPCYGAGCMQRRGVARVLLETVWSVLQGT